MNMVFDKARELGEAIAVSEEYAAMQSAEETAMANAEVAQKMSDYMEAKSNVESELAKDQADPVLIASYSQAMQSLQDELNAHELVQAMNMARQSFSQMMTQVNQVLQFVMTGQTQQPEEGCGGNCSGCSGCH